MAFQMMRDVPVGYGSPTNGSVYRIKIEKSFKAQVRYEAPYSNRVSGIGHANPPSNQPVVISSLPLLDTLIHGRDMNQEDTGGISQANKQERRGVRRVWTKEEEDALLSILDETVETGGRADCGSFKSGTVKNIETRMLFAIPDCGLKANPHIETKMKFWKKQHGIVYDMLNTSGFGWNDVRKYIEVNSDAAWNSYVQAERFRGNHFSLYERLDNKFGKDRATGKAAQTPNQQAADFGEVDNFGNEFEIPESFSPMSMNQSQFDFNGNQDASQPSCGKRLRSKSTDPIASSMNSFSDMMKEAMEKTTEAFKEFGQILATNKANEYERIAYELQNIGIRRVGQVRVMKMFLQKPEITRIFKASYNDEDKHQFIMEILAGEFDD
ncbi:hypothetical protein Dsin_002541 [Dipteronia sinensis]|uniref:Myb/SANT-like domain-containing protein n=1 Tax=Dipteronia sinensis TaxID=43782 RepID=A0AAE0B7E2_9ROSI|nr:hypothetical protein Dsin_002541 [Dipteronia sinensis]